jgi:uncharacterized protein YcbK (DUF882 family)
MNQRRSFLKSSALLASALSVTGLVRAAPAPALADLPNERSLHLYNTHTGESLRRVFWAEGSLIPEAMNDINKLLRDHRNNKIAPIDPKLLFLLDQVASKIGGNQGVHIISGYRSPESNRLLQENSSGVAKHSMHLDGKAIDVRIPGRDLASLHKAALQVRGGGVGYYPASQFVHMDTGRLRSW